MNVTFEEKVGEVRATVKRGKLLGWLLGETAEFVRTPWGSQWYRIDNGNVIEVTDTGLVAQLERKYGEKLMKDRVRR